MKKTTKETEENETFLCIDSVRLRSAQEAETKIIKNTEHEKIANTCKEIAKLYK